VYTLNLGSSNEGSYNVVVTADSDNSISEPNESNNTKEVILVVGNGRNENTTGKDADLTVKILETGYVDSYGRISNNYSRSDSIGVRFEIKNIGNKTARDWKFEASLPTYDNEDTYTSSKQLDLKPGERVEYTLGFEDPRSRGYFEIEVDFDDDVDENSESNNTARIRITN
jgi:subtilase family serine protease